MLANVRLAPDVFAVVMATGIVSIAAEDHQYYLISRALDVLAVLIMVTLVGLAAATLGRRGSFGFGDVGDPLVTLRLFTFVAACTVLGVRLQRWPMLTWTLGAIGLAAWWVLVPLAARSMWRHRWAGLRDHARGAWELASVGTSGLAIVLARLSEHVGSDGALVVAVAAWLLAIAIYCLMTGLVLWHAATNPTAPEVFEPDDWILMGALAIATLAGDEIHDAATVLAAPHWLAGGTRVLTVVTWVVATAWIPPLVYAGIQRINRRAGALDFAGVWWAMVFPLGMYSTATHAMGVETGWEGFRTISLVLFWIAATVWLIVAIGGVLSIRRAVLR